jgi:hypothetical protein
MGLAALVPVLEPFAVLAMLTMARAGGLLLALPTGSSTARCRSDLRSPRAGAGLAHEECVR